MRLPSIRKLTREQKDVYLYASADNHVLVHGPPGTGKTLIACLRAQELSRRSVPVVLGMFSNVLRKYSSNAGDGRQMPSKTVLKWFYDWWGNSGLPPSPETSSALILQVPYEEKGEVKRLGAHWDPREYRPWQPRKGVWKVDPEVYFNDPDAFSRWRIWHGPPSVDGKPYKIDWDAVKTQVMDHADRINRAALELGVLLVDEGQDFSPGFYAFLRTVSALGGMRKTKHQLRCFVLADENQQLTDENSTLDQIQEALNISDGNRYSLLDNFRNSREIAEFAREFFADVGVLPRLPETRSEKPLYVASRDRAAIVERIITWVNNNPRKETGVFVFTESARKHLAEELRVAAARVRGRNITVQTYSWKSRATNRAENLLFDEPDVITVLHVQSCKGLEFDAVFIVDSHEMDFGMYGADRYRMQMFVAVSRAREWVCLMDSGPGAVSGDHHTVLPGPDFLRREGEGMPSGTRNSASGGREAPHRSNAQNPAPVGRGSRGFEPGSAARGRSTPGGSEERRGPPPGLRSAPEGRPTLRLRTRAGRGTRGSSESGETPSRGESRRDWVREVREAAEAAGVEIDDRRSRGGALWVRGGRELEGVLRPLGFHFSELRDQWWRKT